MNELTELGQSLVEYAETEAAFTAQRGLLDELFPFIFVASKRMSLRAISRWLAETKKVRISANALSKAMRNQEEYWQSLVEDVGPSASFMAESYGIAPAQLLEDFKLFKGFEGAPPSVAHDFEKDFQHAVQAAGVLRNRWFSLPEEARNQCRRHFANVFHDCEASPKGR